MDQGRGDIIIGENGERQQVRLHRTCRVWIRVITIAQSGLRQTAVGWEMAVISHRIDTSGNYWGQENTFQQNRGSR